MSPSSGAVALRRNVAGAVEREADEWTAVVQIEELSRELMRDAAFGGQWHDLDFGVQPRALGPEEDQPWD